MKRLRSHPRVDTLAVGHRWDPVRWGRRIYLVIISVLALIILNYFFGDALILRADGLVVNQRYAVSATYAAKVAAVYVKEGDHVTEGQVLAKLESAEVLKDIAQLSVQYADLAARDAQLSIRAKTTRDLIPLAERHAQQTANAIVKYDTMKELIPTILRDQALGSEYTTAARLAELKSESSVIEKQLPLLDAAEKRAANALAQLEAFYDQGNIKASVGGLVGSRLTVPGQAVKFGDTLFDIYGTTSQVLAYLPEMYLFGVRPGDKVNIRGGGRTVVGTVEAVLQVTEALPPEFQNTFRPRERSQLIRISLPEHNDFAVAQKIEVRGCAAGWCWASDEKAGESMVSRLWNWRSS